MPRKKSYILTLTAEQDFREAKQWSLSRWGKDQTKQYFSDLNDGAEYIANNYQSIKDNDYLTANTGLGIYAVREHYMVYMPVEEKTIIIVALIRQVRDVPAILQANNYIIKRELEEIKKMIFEGKFSELAKK